MEQTQSQASAGLWRKTAQFAVMTQSARLGQVGARWRSQNAMQENIAWPEAEGLTLVVSFGFFIIMLLL